MVGRVVWGWGGLMWVGVRIGAWVEPVCVYLRSRKCSYVRAWRGKTTVRIRNEIINKRYPPYSERIVNIRYKYETKNHCSHKK